jgi:hypothetical protein
MARDVSSRSIDCWAVAFFGHRLKPASLRATISSPRLMPSALASSISLRPLDRAVLDFNRAIFAITLLWLLARDAPAQWVTFGSFAVRGSAAACGVQFQDGWRSVGVVGEVQQCLQRPLDFLGVIPGELPVCPVAGALPVRVRACSCHLFHLSTPVAGLSVGKTRARQPGLSGSI